MLHPDTKRHILEVAEKLHYVPDLNGKNLKTQAAKVIGLFLTSIKGPYYSILADSIYQGCKKYGYELNIFIGDRADNMMANILGSRIDGEGNFEPEETAAVACEQLLKTVSG